MTQRKPLQERDRVEKQLNRALLETAVQGILAVSTDGRIVLVNSMAEKLFGYSKKELLDQPLEKLLPKEYAKHHAEHRADYFENPRTRPMGLGLDLAGRRKDGSEFPVEISLNYINTEDGGIAIAFVTDITERKRIQKQRQQLAAIVENSTGFVALAGLDGRVTYVNKAGLELLGTVSLDIAAITTPDDLVAQEDREEFVHVALPTVRREGQWLGERRFKHVGTGELIPMDIHSFLVRDEAKDDPIAIAIVARDLRPRKAAETERVALQKQLHQATKMEAVGRLAGGVAHDFNNLLTALSGFSELLLDYFDEDHPLREGAEETFRTCQRSTSLVRQLLAVSRRQMVKPVVLDINSVLTEVQKMLRGLIAEDIEFTVELSASPVLVKADVSQIEQVVLNLVVNAGDAMPTGGKLLIRTESVVLDEDYVRQHAEGRPGPHVVLTVSDTGNGMEQETLSHVFEPFFTTKESRGTGLGLATVYGIVQQNGGHIRVDSEPAKGTIFEVHLPRAEATPEHSTRSIPRPVRHRGLETILVVEDENVVRLVVKETLRKAGYTVLEAKNAGEAFRLAEQHLDRIDLVLTDVVMPRVNGPELVSRLESGNPDLRKLYMSGHADDAIAQHGIVAEGAPFLEKPFTREALISKVREVLGR